MERERLAFDGQKWEIEISLEKEKLEHETTLAHQKLEIKLRILKLQEEELRRKDTDPAVLTRKVR